MSMIGFALSAASGIAEFSQQQQAADEQNRLYEQNRVNALAAFQDKQNALNNRISQERESTATQQMDTSLEAQKARATNRVAAGENGVEGNSVEALQRDISSREQRVNDRVGVNSDWTIAQLTSEKKASSNQTLSQINSVRQADSPSFAGSMLKIASGGINSLTQSKQRSSF